MSSESLKNVNIRDVLESARNRKNELMPYVTFESGSNSSATRNIPEGTGEQNDEVLRTQLKDVEHHLEMMGYDLLLYGAGVALTELMSGYDAAEPASHIAHTTMARDIKKANSHIIKLARIATHASLLLEVLKEYKDDGHLRHEQWQNDSLAVYHLMVVDDQQSKRVNDILSDPIAGKERIATSRISRRAVTFTRLS